MHAAALADMRRADPRFEGWKYFRFDIAPDRLPAALDLMHRRGFRGINLTVPHKVLALGLVTDADPLAQAAGAVNTLLAGGSGWRGFNTDGYGLAQGIREDLGISLRGAPIVLLGAGGAARAAAVECLRSGCAALWIVNRTRSNLDALLTQLAPHAGSIPVHGIEPGRAAPGLPRGAIVINATSLGLRAEDPPPADLRNFPGMAAAYDMIYNPAETSLLAQARELRLPHANGVGMLVHQGAKALEIWTGVPATTSAPAMRSAVANALGLAIPPIQPAR
jgi:shikimate dehydrogenase